MQSLQMNWCRLDDLTGPQMHAVLAAREAVFVVEQNCAYQEADHLDRQAWHLIAFHGEQIVGYLRLVEPGGRFAEPSIGRVLTTKNFRGTGLGKQLMVNAIAKSRELYRGQSVRISAQAYLKRFYESLGFRPVSDEYPEDGIPHVEMLLTHP
jgi:ElaA protein